MSIRTQQAVAVAVGHAAPVGLVAAVGESGV